MDGRHLEESRCSMPLFQSPKISSNTRPTLWIGLLLSSLLVTALPLNAAAKSDYDTAVSCAGGLGFMATMLPAGSDPAKEAAEREAAWTAEAQRVSRKNQSSTQADIHSATDETKAVMMSGDQAKIAAFMGPLNDACAELPKTEAEIAADNNPFDLKEAGDFNNFNAAIMCAGRYQLGAQYDEPEGTNEKADAAIRYDRFRDYAKSIFPRMEDDKLDLEIRKAAAEWIVEISGMTDKSMSVIAICERGYDNLK